MSAKISQIKISSWYRTEGRSYAFRGCLVRFRPQDCANPPSRAATPFGMRARASLQHCSGVLQGGLGGGFYLKWGGFLSLRYFSRICDVS